MRSSGLMTKSSTGWLVHGRTGRSVLNVAIPVCTNHGDNRTMWTIERKRAVAISGERTPPHSVQTCTGFARVVQRHPSISLAAQPNAHRPTQMRTKQPWCASKCSRKMAMARTHAHPQACGRLPVCTRRGLSVLLVKKASFSLSHSSPRTRDNVNRHTATVTTGTYTCPERQDPPFLAAVS